ncbi:MAG: hypothetical protein SF162_12485 [bacterium]|nr:hypothetical protein [bacterium]
MSKMHNRRDAEQFEVEIESLGTGGDGVGRYKSRTVFVPFTIPGEIVRARAIDTTETVIHAEGVTLVDASADRVLPRCPHFGIGRCGKCHWQHIDPAVQALIKQDMLAEALERGGVRGAPIRPIIASPQAWGYNHHMTFSVGGHDAEPILRPVSDPAPDDAPPLDGEAEAEPAPPLMINEALYLGFPDYHDEARLIRIEECHILHPDLLALYAQIDLDLSNYRRVKMQIGSDGAMMLILTALEDSAPELLTELRVSVNLILPDNEPMNLIGDSHTVYEVLGHPFRVTAGSYFRPHLGQMPNLVNAVIDLLAPQPHESILDLYAGVGVFSAFIAPRADLVTLIESYPPAVTDADVNLAQFENVDVIEGGVDMVLSALDEPYHAAVIDPPPKGITSEALTLLRESGVQRAVYLADDPVGFAKTVRQFGKAGYQLASVQPIDLAPQTAWVDLVALFVQG